MTRAVIFRGARFYTLDPGRPVAEALAVWGDRIAGVGPLDDLRAALPRAETIDLTGLTVLPAFTDSHCHLVSYGLSLARIDLRETRSLADAVARVAGAARTTPEGSWVLGRGWDKNLWAEGRWPTRDDLDAVTPRHPVALTSKDGHLLWVNTMALDAAGVDETTSDPKGGEIVRDARGRPSGLLKEQAKAPVLGAISRPDDAAMRHALDVAMAEAHRLGLAGVHDMEGPETFALLQSVHREGRLRLRVWNTIPSDHLDAARALGLRTGVGDAWLRVGGLKIFADGTLGSQTASMIEPFQGQPENVGITIHSAEGLRDLVGSAVRGGLWPVIHAIGDRANRDVLDAFAAHRAEAASHGVRFRTEHVQLLHPQDLPRLAALGVIASMQPIHATADRDIADRYWGARGRTAYAWRSLLASGAVLAFGSDAPVETIDPWRGLYAAVTRREPGDGRPPWRPEEAVAVEEAVRAYTVGAAYASGEEDTCGTLAPDRLADFIAIDRDILREAPGDPEVLVHTRVLATVIAGAVVHAQGPLAGLQELSAGGPGAGSPGG